MSDNEIQDLDIEEQSMISFENSITSQYEDQNQPDLDKEAIHEKIKQLNEKLNRARMNKHQKEEHKIEKEILSLKIKLQVSDVTISRSSQDSYTPISDSHSGQLNLSQPVDESKTDLTGFWHYEILSGNLQMDLCADDTDESIYENRQEYIEQHCRPYVDQIDLGNGLKIPSAIWKSLFPHQRTAIDWLWNLWQNDAGGIEGDEMGLGKTAIVSIFILGLIQSQIISKPVLIISPVTLLKQWVRELHIWCPSLRVFLFHNTRTNHEMSDLDILTQVTDHPYVLVTNYDSIIKTKDIMELQIIDWAMIACDEAHKIRNHQSIISHLVKKLYGDFKIAITGSPIQNSLKELWSIFDFAYHNHLGTLDAFEKEFSEPIKRGSFKNAAPQTVFEAYEKAITLRDLIKPYILRRMKKDVEADLPSKKEKILFTSLTETQRKAYLNFTNSVICNKIIEEAHDKNNHDQLFIGVDALRKICNHPSLFDSNSYPPVPELSAKLNLLKKILPVWKEKGHRCLLFSQYLEMLTFIGELLEMLGLDYFRIDGKTDTSSRQKIIDKFNAGEKFACILSTKVGGVGVNLIGANRVVLVDPDWNPATDSQAIERAWRIGQQRNVYVYRMISKGTIEEKMYKKQIFKQFLANKILQNPNQRRLVNKTTIRELFQLDEDNEALPNKLENEGQKSNETFNLMTAVSNDPTPDQSQSQSDDCGEKELTEMIMNDGNLKEQFDHDGLFGEADRITERYLAQKKAKHALDVIKNSNNTFGHTRDGGFVHDPKNDQEQNSVEVSIFNKLVDFFNQKSHRIATAQDIISHFRTDLDIKNHPKLAREILKRIAVYNKKTKQWYLVNKFKRN